MLIVGKANWALPEALDRVLPHLNVEGSVNDDSAPEPKSAETPRGLTPARPKRRNGGSGVTQSSAHFDRTLEQLTTHRRAHVAELARLEQAEAAPGELRQHRELIARLHSHITQLIRSALLSHSK